MGRIPIIAGNWKMNNTVGEAVDLVRQLKPLVRDVRDVEIAVAPAFTALYAVRQELEGSPIGLAAQNLFYEVKGAYTGEISPLMLVEVGCRYVIIGHSERRQFFGETDESVNRKIRAAVDHELSVIFCIGESLREREGQQTFSVVERQITGGLKGFDEKQMRRLTIAYEPVWAIGTGKTATPEQAEEVHRFIRDKIKGLFSREAAENVRIQYGGSVTAENISGLMQQPDIDGALVGGASLKAESFARIVRFR